MNVFENPWVKIANSAELKLTGRSQESMTWFRITFLLFSFFSFSCHYIHEGFQFRFGQPLLYKHEV